MSRWWMLGIVGALAGCGNKDLHRYDNSLFELGAGFNARMVCSCLFVMERTEDECREWTRVSPDFARFKVDHEARTVTSKVLGGAKTTAVWVDEQTGCRFGE